MSVLIKEEEPVERYHAHWLEIGGLNNQAKIKGRLCFRVSPFAWIRLVSWSGLCGGGRGERGEKDRNKGGWMWQLDIPPVKNPSIFSQATELGQRGLSEHAHTYLLQCADVIDFLYCTSYLSSAPDGHYIIVMSHEFGFESYCTYSEF